MDNSRRMKLVWRWSACVVCLVAMFWGVWYLIAGNIPIITTDTVAKIAWTPNWTLQLLSRFPVSRLWDIPLSAVVTAMIVLTATSKTMLLFLNKADKIHPILCISLLIFLLGSLMPFVLYCVGFGLVIGPIIGPIPSFVGGLIFVLVTLLFVGLIYVLSILSDRFSGTVLLERLERWFMAKEP